ncbi:MAG: ABC transporter substrate-binding protein [Chloroflexi bacterium]|nr:ABC transporter substrate-binding protein [Chloroflexota bacterium]
MKQIIPIIRSKRFLLALGGVLFAAVLGVFVTRRIATDAQDATWNRIQSTRVLRVGLDATYPPFESSDADGQLVGYDIDLAQALGSYWQVDVQFVQIHFDGLYDALEAGKCDLIISALPYDSTMTQDMLYSTAYMQLGQVLLVAEPSAGIQDWQDLGGRQVAVELGSEAHQLVRQLARDTGQAITITAERESAQALADLLDGRAEALVVDRTTALGYLKQHPALAQVGELRDAVPLVIAVASDANKTIDEINLVLEQLRTSGMLEQLEARWF